MQALLQAYGATMRDGETVTDVRQQEDIVVVESDTGIYFSHKVIVAPGPWARELLAKIGLDIPVEVTPYSRPVL